MIRLLVTGYRNWTDRAAICAKLKEIGVLNIDVLIEGEAEGADKISKEEAIKLGLSSQRVLEFPANWKVYGRAAGPIRNRAMLQSGKPTQALAFHNDLNQSRGTRDMVKKLRKAGIPVWISGKDYL